MPTRCWTLLLAVLSLLASSPRAAHAQCGVLLEQSNTIPGDVDGFWSNLIYDFDGEGPLPPELVVGADKGRVFAFNGTRWRQLGPAIWSTIVGWTVGMAEQDPRVFDLLNFRGDLYAVVSPSTSSNGQGWLFRWNGTSWIPVPRPATPVVSGWFRRATVWNDRIVIVGRYLSYGGPRTSVLSFDGVNWQSVGDQSFDPSGALLYDVLSTSDGRLLIAGWNAIPNRLVVELFNGTWVTRLSGRADGLPMDLKEINGTLHLSGRLYMTPSQTMPSYLLRQAGAGWEQVYPVSDLARVNHDGVSAYYPVGDQLLIGTQLRGDLFSLDSTGVRPLTMSHGYIDGFRGGFAEYRDRVYALGYGTVDSIIWQCPGTPTLLSAPTNDLSNWRIIPPLLSNGALPGDFGTLHAGFISGSSLVVASLTGAGLVPDSGCPFTPAGWTIQYTGGTWGAAGERLNSGLRGFVQIGPDTIAYGSSTMAGTRPITPGLARWDGTTWQSYALPIIDIPNIAIGAACNWNGDLVIVDRNTRQMRRWNGIQWTSLGVAPAIDAPMFTVAGGDLYYSGGSGVYRWTGSAWAAYGTSISVLSLGSMGGVPVVGEFSSVRRWTGTAWVAMGSFPSAVGRVRSFIHHAETTYVGMDVVDFQSPASQGSVLMRYTTQDTWVPAFVNHALRPQGTPPWGNTYGKIFSGVPDGDTLHLLGHFWLLGGLPFESHARFYTGAPRLLTPPVSAQARFRCPAYFSIDPEVHHDANQTYQWRRDGQPIADGSTPSGSIISGTTSLYLRIQRASPADAGMYSVVVTNGCGSTTSAEVALSVFCAADQDNGSGVGLPDGGVTIDDLLYYVERYADGVVRADLDDGSGLGLPDGGVTIDDLLFYLFRFEIGC